MPRTEDTFSVWARLPGSSEWKSIGPETGTSKTDVIKQAKEKARRAMKPSPSGYPPGTEFDARRWRTDQYGVLRNPAVKLPSKFTPAEVRVNEQGKVQIRINPAKLGSGGRFAKCVESVEAKGGAADPRAVCAAAGLRKYGKRKFLAMARAGRKQAQSNPSNADKWRQKAYDAGLKQGQTGGPDLTAQWFQRNSGIGPGSLSWTTPDTHRSVAKYYYQGYKDGIQYYLSGKRPNPSKRSTLRRVRKALTKYVRNNPHGLKRWTVKVPKTPYDTGYTLSIRAKTRKSALNQAREYCSERWAKYTGKPKSQYRLPRGTKATETA